MNNVFKFTLIFFIGLYGQNEENGLVQWLTFKEAQEKNKSFQKPFLVDIYTDWCGWCKVMMRTTYSNPGLAAYINQNFWPVKFNAETKDTIEFNGKIYKPLSPAPRTPHELALFFLGQSLSYPSTVFMANEFQYRLLSQGYLKEQDIEPFLVFFAENVWRTTPFEEFRNYFHKTFYVTPYQRSNPPLPFHSKDYPSGSKKIIILGAEFCLTGKMLDKQFFSDSTLKEVLKKFKVFYFDLERNDTLFFQDTAYTKQLINQYPLHSLGLRLTGQRFTIPALILLDEKNKILDVLNFYMSPEQLRPILEYYGNDIYKKSTWNEFISRYSSSGKSAGNKNTKTKK
jgi:thioredoxin-related protein